MSFDEKYQLVDLVEDDSAKTFVAREISTGRNVSVFLFVGEQARLNAELIERLRAADRRQFPELIEAGDNHGTAYVVTQPIGGFSELKDRVQRLKPTPEIPSPHKTEDAFSRAGVWHVLSASTPSESRKPATKSTTVAKSIHPAGDQPAAAQTSPSQPDAAPGEFTAMFQTPAAPLGEPAIHAPKPVPVHAPPPPPQPAPGEFTRFFQSAPMASGPTAALPKSGPQGQFTRVFGGSGRPEAPTTGTGLFSTTSPPRQEKQGDDRSSPPPAFKAPAGEFTRIFGATSTRIPTPVGGAPTPPAAPSQSEANAPGEYTRMFGAQSLPQAPEAEPAPEQTPVAAPPEASIPARQNSKLPLVLTGIIFLLLIVIVILFFTMRK